MAKRVCKRCGQRPKYTDPWHRGFGERSRIDINIKICSDCSVDEAMQCFLNEGLTPRSEWPVQR